MKKRGSAIVIAIFLVTAIGGIAFSFGRLFLLEAASYNAMENGVSAYYAAESGVEEGFLRYRYNKNVEVPFVNWRLGNDNTFRANLTTGAVTNGTGGAAFAGITKTTTVSANANQMYDLRMGFIGNDNQPIYGQDINNDGSLNASDLMASNYGTGDHSFLRLAKDETYKIDLSNINFSNLVSNDLRLFAKFLSLDRGRALLYTKLTIDYFGNGSNVKEYKAMISSNPVLSCTSNILGSSGAGCQNELLSASLDRSTPDIVWTRTNLLSAYMSEYGASQPVLANQPKVTLSIRPLYTDAFIGITTNRCSLLSSCMAVGVNNKANIISGSMSKIVSTGYFGGATRTIEANIDRQSGTLYDLFDYVIFEKQ